MTNIIFLHQYFNSIEVKSHIIFKSNFKYTMRPSRFIKLVSQYSYEHKEAAVLSLHFTNKLKNITITKINLINSFNKILLTNLIYAISVFNFF